MDNEAHKLELCLKCGSRITHVPYRFEGKVFHARCLLCNGCGKRLVGKPFITKNRQIFCGEQCKSQFEHGIKPPHLKDPPEPLIDNFSDTSHNVSMDESLLEALEEIQEGPSAHLVKIAIQAPNPPGHSPAERVTDYPVGVSPESSQAQSLETDSISTYSESSLTSDSSFAYDASRKPRKKILKTSNAAQGRNKLKVRWNLKDQDNISISSASSIRSDSRLLYNHREAARRTLQNWRDFEAPIPPGSCGLTPTKNKLLSQSANFLSPLSQKNRDQLHSLSPPNGIRPRLHRTHSGDQLPSNNNNPSPGYKSHQLLMRHDSAPTKGLALLNHLAVSPQKEEGTPYKLSHARLSPQSQWQEEDSSSMLNVSVFQLDEQNLPQLETSNLEDRKSSHLFEFPRKIQPLPRAKPDARISSTSSSDADDYDHLREKEEARQKTESNLEDSRQDITPTGTLRAKERLAAQAPDEQWYTKQDIEDALRSLEDGELEETNDASSLQTLSSDWNAGSVMHKSSKPQAPPVSDDKEDYDHLHGPPPIPPKQRKSGHSQPKTLLSSKSDAPPPLPPKTRKPPNNDVPLSPSSASDPGTSRVKFHMDIPTATSTPHHSSAGKNYKLEENLILPPPPEFAGSFTLGQGRNSQGQTFPPSSQLGNLPHSHSCDTLTGSDSPPQHLAYEENHMSKEVDIYPEAASTTQPALSWSSPTEEIPMFRINEHVIEGAEDPVRKRSPVRNFFARSDEKVPQQQHSNVTDHIHRHGSSSSPPKHTRPETAVGKELGKMENSFTRPDFHHQHAKDRYHLPVVDSNLTKKTSAEMPREQQQFLKWFQKNSKPPSTKTVPMDTELQKLLDELDINTIMEEAASQQHAGVCCVCHTIISSTRSLLSHAGKVYHIGCFSCAQCGCPLKGKQLFTLQNGSVLCEEHYRRLLLTQQQHTVCRRNQQQHQPYLPPHNSLMSHPPQSGYPYRRVVTKPSNTYTMV